MAMKPGRCFPPATARSRDQVKKPKHARMVYTCSTRAGVLRKICWGCEKKYPLSSQRKCLTSNNRTIASLRPATCMDGRNLSNSSSEQLFVAGVAVATRNAPPPSGFHPTCFLKPHNRFRSTHPVSRRMVVSDQTPTPNYETRPRSLCCPSRPDCHVHSRMEGGRSVQGGGPKYNGMLAWCG